MTALRSAIRELPRFPDLRSLNVSQVATFMAMNQPVSIRDLLTRVDRLPPALTLTQPVVTGAALGGSVTLTITRRRLHLLRIDARHRVPLLHLQRDDQRPVGRRGQRRVAAHRPGVRHRHCRQPGGELDRDRDRS